MNLKIANPVAHRLANVEFLLTKTSLSRAKERGELSIDLFCFRVDFRINWFVIRPATKCR